ncbi:hypothetical protein [Hymenobacter tenuis]
MHPRREPDLTFSQIKKDINLVALLLTLGYQPNKAENGPSADKGRYHVFDYHGNPRLDQVIVFRAPNGDYRYFNPAHDKDKGTVIDFLKFRVANPRISSITSTPGKSVWVNVLENAKQFLNRPADQRPNTPALQQAMAPVQKGDAYLPDFLQKTTPLTDMRYLLSRGLRQELLTNDCFRGRILNHVHEGKTKQGQACRFVNTAFPQIYQDKIVGLEIEANKFKGQAADSLKSAALWLSNSGVKTHTLIVTESAVDCLSHYQLKQPEHTMYASTSGNLTDNKIFEIKRLVQDHNLRTVKLGFDDTLEGHLCDTQMLSGLAMRNNPMAIERNMPGLLTVGIYSDQPSYFNQLHTAARQYNQQVSDGYQSLAGTSAQGSVTLNTELISVTKAAEKCYQFHIPKRIEALAYFNQALVRSLTMMVRVEIDKPKSHGWNGQLKRYYQQKIGAARQQASDTAASRTPSRGLRR